MSDAPQFDFPGLLAPLLTPFSATLAADSERLIELARRLLNQGVAGLVVFDAGGEGCSLTAAERLALLDALIEAGIPAAKLVPATGTCALPDSVALSRHAVEHGCGGVLIEAPFYYQASTDGLHEYYAELIQRVGDARLRLYLDHSPPPNGVAIGTELIEKLLKDYPNTLAGVKDGTGDWDNTRTLLQHFPELAVYPSSEARLLDALRLGAAGCCSTAANINAVAIAELAAEWRSPQAEQRQQRVAELHRLLDAYPPVPALKLALAHYRDDPAWLLLRPPLSPLLAEQGGTLLAALRTLNFTP